MASVYLFTPLSCLQFAEKFQEVKEAAKLARDKSQEKVETLSNHSQVNHISAARDSDSMRQLGSAESCSAAEEILKRNSFSRAHKAPKGSDSAFGNS